MSRSKKVFRALLAALGIYAFVSLSVFFVNFITGELPFTFGLSISVNVGHSWWSTIVYFIANCGVVWLMSTFYRKTALPLVYKIFGFEVLAALLAVSACPIGLISEGFDDAHNVLARVLLISLIVHTAVGTACFLGNRKCLIRNLLLLAVDIAMVFIVIFNAKLFFSYVFISEFILIITYFLSLLNVLAAAGNAED